MDVLSHYQILDIPWLLPQIYFIWCGKTTSAKPEAEWLLKCNFHCHWKWQIFDKTQRSLWTIIAVYFPIACDSHLTQWLMWRFSSWAKSPKSLTVQFTSCGENSGSTCSSFLWKRNSTVTILWTLDKWKRKSWCVSDVPFQDNNKGSILKEIHKTKAFWAVASTKSIHLETSCLRCWCVCPYAPICCNGPLRSYNTLLSLQALKSRLALRVKGRQNLILQQGSSLEFLSLSQGPEVVSQLS